MHRCLLACNLPAPAFVSTEQSICGIWLVNLAFKVNCPQASHCELKAEFVILLMVAWQTQQIKSNPKIYMDSSFMGRRQAFIIWIEFKIGY